MPITHAKVSAIADGGDAALVLPSDWNDDHTVDSSTFARLYLTQTVNLTGQTSGDAPTVDFDTITEQVGTDVTRNAGDHTKVDINADGIYAISCVVSTAADDPAQGGDASIALSITPTGYPASAEGQPNASYGVYQANVGLTVWLASGSQVRASGSLTTLDASQWTLYGSSIVVQRVT